MKPKIKSTKWYRWFWLPERRKVKTMQALLDHNMPEIENKPKKALHDHLIYGTPIVAPEDSNNDN